jgi:hypothetical protein
VTKKEKIGKDGRDAEERKLVRRYWRMILVHFYRYNQNVMCRNKDK